MSVLPAKSKCVSHLLFHWTVDTEEDADKTQNQWHVLVFDIAETEDPK